MTYEAAKKAVITAKQAEQEIIKHHLHPQDFYNEVGKKDMYKAREVLKWLGY